MATATDTTQAPAPQKSLANRMRECLLVQVEMRCESDGFPGQGTLAGGLKQFLNQAERSWLRNCLTVCHWSVTDAVRVAGISRARFYEKIKRYGIRKPRNYED